MIKLMVANLQQRYLICSLSSTLFLLTADLLQTSWTCTWTFKQRLGVLVPRSDKRLGTRWVWGNEMKRLKCPKACKKEDKKKERKKERYGGINEWVNKRKNQHWINEWNERTNEILRKNIQQTKERTNAQKQ